MVKMERKKCFLIELFWVAVLFQFTMLASGNNVTEPPLEPTEESLGYAWSSWSSWGPCSKTCGGGVSMQERHCLPRESSRSRVPEGTLPPPIITVRITREAPSQDCQGVARRYHECNTKPCPGREKDTRAEQCAAYDRRPFRGRFYTWVPYIDGNSPCTLNCRPLGQHFYASLALAADGTPCTKPGTRAICIQGICKIQGQLKIAKKDLCYLICFIATGTPIITLETPKDEEFIEKMMEKLVSFYKAFVLPEIILRRIPANQVCREQPEQD